MRREMFGVLAVLLLATPASAAPTPTANTSLPKPIVLHILPNRHYRLDDGPELDRLQLRTALKKIMKRKPIPEIRFNGDKNVNFKAVGEAIIDVQEAGGHMRIGFITAPPTSVPEAPAQRGR